MKKTIAFLFVSLAILLGVGICQSGTPLPPVVNTTGTQTLQHKTLDATNSIAPGAIQSGTIGVTATNSLQLGGIAASAYLLSSTAAAIYQPIGSYFLTTGTLPWAQVSGAPSFLTTGSAAILYQPIGNYVLQNGTTSSLTLSGNTTLTGTMSGGVINMGGLVINGTATSIPFMLSGTGAIDSAAYQPVSAFVSATGGTATTLTLSGTTTFADWLYGTSEHLSGNLTVLNLSITNQNGLAVNGQNINYAGLISITGSLGSVIPYQSGTAFLTSDTLTASRVSGLGSAALVSSTTFDLSGTAATLVNSAVATIAATGTAAVSGTSLFSGSAAISGSASQAGTAITSGSATVSGSAAISGSASQAGMALVSNSSTVSGSAAGAVQTSQANQPNGYLGLDGSGNAVGTFIPRNGTETAINSVVLAAGELAAVTDYLQLRVGDGSTSGGNIIAPPITGNNVLYVGANGTPSQNGIQLGLAILTANGTTPNGAALSATNRFLILLATGQYYTTSFYTPGAFVDIIGLGQHPSEVQITSSNANGYFITMLNGTNNILSNFSLVSSASTSTATQGGLRIPSGSAGAANIYSNLILMGSGSNGLGGMISPLAGVAGTWKNVTTGDGCFGYSGGNAVFSGTAIDCTAGSNSFGNTFSGFADHCTSTGTNSFGAAAVTGTLVRCSAVLFGSGTGTGSYIDCYQNGVRYGPIFLASGTGAMLIRGGTSYYTHVTSGTMTITTTGPSN